jgi:hypothetical protein
MSRGSRRLTRSWRRRSPNSPITAPKALLSCRGISLSSSDSADVGHVAVVIASTYSPADSPTGDYSVTLEEENAYTGDATEDVPVSGCALQVPSGSDETPENPLALASLHLAWSSEPVVTPSNAVPGGAGLEALSCTATDQCLGVGLDQSSTVPLPRMWNDAFRCLFGVWAMPLFWPWRPVGRSLLVQGRRDRRGPATRFPRWLSIKSSAGCAAGKFRPEPLAGERRWRPSRRLGPDGRELVAVEFEQVVRRVH